VTLAQLAAALREGAAALRDGRGRLVGTIAVTDAFVRNPRDESAAMYGTDGARELFLEYEGSDWAGVLSRLDGGDLGMTPLLMGRRAAPPPAHVAAGA
jgi:hypothetical protein